MDWFEHTKLASYCLWELTGYDGALDLWYAVEDIAAFFEQANIVEAGMVDSIRGLGPGSEGYVWFVRNIAFRLHVYTRNEDGLTNWFLVEQLLVNPTWVNNLTAMAALLKTNAGGAIKQIRSDMVRSLYVSQTF